MCSGGTENPWTASEHSTNQRLDAKRTTNNKNTVLNIFLTDERTDFTFLVQLRNQATIIFKGKV